MSDDLLALADRIWMGQSSITDFHPMSVSGSIVEIVPGVAFVPGFSNAIAFDAGESLVLVDSGGFLTPDQVHSQVRGWSDKPLTYAVFTHGHVDHVFGVGAFEAEADPVQVIAHENVPGRFDRYVLTAGYNSVINQRQFQVPGLQWPTEYRYPDLIYSEEHRFSVGELTFELRHAKGETDDHTWVWVEAKKLLCCGDLFIWCSPNAGNPQKAQRYPREWAAALRTMHDLGADVMLPGHGLPVIGAERVREALDTTASYLESIVEQTLALMNEGASLEDVVAQVRPPEELAAKPWLQPIYDEPEFIVRNLWRLYGGWYEGMPSQLKPAGTAELGSALAETAGGTHRLVEAARTKAAAGNFRLACELIDLAWAVDPNDDDIAALRAELYEARSSAEPSTMSKGIFTWAARTTHPPSA